MQVVLTARAANGIPIWSVPGNVSFAAHLAPEFRARLFDVFFGPKLPLSPTPGTRGQPLVNNVGDADTSAISLRMLDELLDHTAAGCFNHPRAVLDSGRDRVATKLSGIAGLQMPRTIKVRISEPADIVREASEHQLEFPLIIRVAGSHGGDTTVKVDSAGEVASRLRNLPWGGRDLYLTQFVDYRDEDGRHRKMRLVVAGRQVFLRHLIVADDWHLHAQDRDDAAAAEEMAALTTFTSTLLPMIQPAVFAIADALALDFFGIDCSLRPDGRLLVFEANAAMNILHNTRPSPNCWDAPIRLIHDALTVLLFDPARWRFPNPRAIPA
jgi:glutathione synthase/RimK-type ligase-like ATP-grasp enzyme